MFTRIIGYASDSSLSAQLHDLGHENRVEYLSLSREDAQRRRLRVRTDKGRECLLALDRDERLGDGAVIALDEEHAIVVRLLEEDWLTFEPADAEAALELGYFCGNLHWRVRFKGKCIGVAQQGPVDDYLARLEPLLSAAKVRLVT